MNESLAGRVLPNVPGVEVCFSESEEDQNACLELAGQCVELTTGEYIEQILLGGDGIDEKDILGDADILEEADSTDTIDEDEEYSPLIQTFQQTEDSGEIDENTLSKCPLRPASAYIIRATGADDVAKALVFAKTHNLRITAGSDHDSLEKYTSHTTYYNVSLS